ncbi:MAG: 16S rRNA (cytosine(967)-C(5))-methyltransferase RsmB [Pseudomonadota bacterium]
MNTRASAARLLARVVVERRSLDAVLPDGLAAHADARDRALVQELVYGTLRWYYQLEAVLGLLLKKPLKQRDSDLRCLLLAGLYQLRHMALPAHAAINESVQAARQLDKDWATGLVNAVLRNCQRRQAELDTFIAATDSSRYAHPDWLIKHLQDDWPGDWQAVLQAGNQRPPFSLRVNCRHYARADYQALLQRQDITAQPLAHTSHGLLLESSHAVESLPGFAAGAVSVQDGAAQLVAPLLQLAPGQRVLDACAAPGGKTAHILELENGLAGLTAVDVDVRRLQRVHDNLERLGLSAQVLCGDAADPRQWWDGECFDRILLDVPCSATGVIRRHPDIKLLRRRKDIESLSQRQAQLLNAMWPLLSAGGMLLYTTCSVLADENDRQVERFLSTHADAASVAITASWGRACAYGRQLLPGDDDMDGFFFSCVRKT